MIFRHYRIGLCAVALGLGVAVGVPAETVYDGTGSRGRDVPISAADQKKADEADAELAAFETRLRRSAESNPDAMAELASVLEQGYGSAGLDRKTAFDLYEKAADAGNTIGREKMCIAYTLGHGRPVDLNKAMTYCDKLPDDNPVRMFSDGYDYANGLRGPKDETAAAVIYAEAAKKGNGEAMDAMGQVSLALGKPDLAREWFRQAAIHDSADGMDHMAVMVEAGQGGKADSAEAYWLYANAARRGNAHAADWLAVRSSAEPLPRVAVGTNSITETVTDENGTRTRKLDISARHLLRYFPNYAVMLKLNGVTQVHCYVDVNHRVDLCLIQREYPLGYGFGPLIAEAFNVKLSVPDIDGYGRPTAQSVFAYVFKWQVN